jgi:hypothetical protein
MMAELAFYGAKYDENWPRCLLLKTLQKTLAARNDKVYAPGTPKKFRFDGNLSIYKIPNNEDFVDSYLIDPPARRKPTPLKSILRSM